MNHIFTAVKSSAGIREISLHAQQLSQGKIFLTGEITGELAEDVAAQLLYLHQNSIHPVLYINSGGGNCVAGLALCDFIKSFPGGVTTVCTGICASMAAHLLSCGKKGHRYILPHASTLIHQALIHQCPGGNAGSMQQMSKNLNEMNETLVQLLSETTGRSAEEIKEKIEYGDFRMNAQESVAFNLCDSVIDNIYTL